MFNTATIERLALVHPILKQRIAMLDALLPSLQFQVCQGIRTYEEQDALFAKVPAVTKAKGGYSAHNFGYAVDVVPEDITPGQPDWNIEHLAWKALLATAPACGLSEGAEWRTFPDNPHFYLKEFPANPTDAMREAYSAGGLDMVWRLMKMGFAGATNA